MCNTKKVQRLQCFRVFSKFRRSLNSVHQQVANDHRTISSWINRVMFLWRKILENHCICFQVSLISVNIIQSQKNFQAQLEFLKEKIRGLRYVWVSSAICVWKSNYPLTTKCLTLHLSHTIHDINAFNTIIGTHMCLLHNKREHLRFYFTFDLI